MEQWFYQQSNTRQGPVSLDELKVLIVKGTINAETLVWSKGMEQWQALSTVPALSEFLVSAASESPPDEPSPLPSEQVSEPPTIDGAPPPEETAQPAVTSPLGIKLRALGDLHKEGLLSDEEFNAQKSKLLSGGASTQGNVVEHTYESNDQPPCPPSNLGGAIFATLCCCLPFGVVAIIKATKVASVYRQEGYDAALAASEDAKKWVMIAIGFGLFGIIIQVLLEAANGM